MLQHQADFWALICFSVDRSISTTMNLTNICNANCSCAEVLYEPICSHDHLQYYSPCHAGCLTQDKTTSPMVAYNGCCISYAENGTLSWVKFFIECHKRKIFISYKFTIELLTIVMKFNCIQANRQPYRHHTMLALQKRIRCLSPSFGQSQQVVIRNRKSPFLIFL